MRVSAKSDYAIRVLAELAANQHGPLTCETIALAQDIPFRFLKSVVRDLRRAGLVHSQRGCEGGYRLGRDAATISLADVVEAIDGGVLSIHGGSPDELEYATTSDRVADLWRAVEMGVRKILADVSVSDLLVTVPDVPLPEVPPVRDVPLLEDAC